MASSSDDEQITSSVEYMRKWTIWLMMSSDLDSWQWIVHKAEWWAVSQQSWCDEQCYSRIDVMSSVDGNTSILYCKSKLVLLLRLGYLKPFLAGCKKTRQAPGCRVGALHISRCWFYLTVVAGPKLIQKDYKIIWCCVLLCYGSWWFKCLYMWMMKWKMFMKWLWNWKNELVVNCDKLIKFVKLASHWVTPPLSV